MMNTPLDFDEILSWLRECDPARLAQLFGDADAARAANVGPAVHLRALVEISNRCVRQCGYCGLRAGNADLPRYRMSHDEIIACAHQATALGYGTIVLQAGEDPTITTEWLAAIVRQIKADTPLAVTLSLGERTTEELSAWRAAGADRYLLRFETSDAELFALIHPPHPGRPHQRVDRIAILRQLRELGYEVGSGIMLGIPGQTYASVARDLLLFRQLDLDMIGIGPYIPHPATPLATGEWRRPIPAREQVPAEELMVYKAVALTRLVCPQANIPATTALATINRVDGRELGLQRGANVFMPNLTPAPYRALYQIYPNKACISETGAACNGCLRSRISAIGRTVGIGPGGRRKVPAAPSTTVARSQA